MRKRKEEYYCGFGKLWRDGSCCCWVRWEERCMWQGLVEQWIDVSTTEIDRPLLDWLLPLFGMRPYSKEVCEPSPHEVMSAICRCPVMCSAVLPWSAPYIARWCMNNLKEKLFSFVKQVSWSRFHVAPRIDVVLERFWAGVGCLLTEFVLFSIPMRRLSGPWR